MNPSQPQPGAAGTDKNTEKKIDQNLNLVQPRKHHYLVSTRPVRGFEPMATMDLVEGVLDEDPEIDLVKKLRPRGIVGALSEGVAGPARVVVAKMSDHKAELLKMTGAPRGVIVERDLPLTLGMPDIPPSPTAEADAEGRLSPLDALAMMPPGLSVEITVTVLGTGDTPVPGAQVVLYGNGFPAQGTTDAAGKVKMTLLGNSLGTIHALYVKPVSDYWNLYIKDPALVTEAENPVRLAPLGSTLPGFPDKAVVGWGQKAMNMDKLPANFTGKGVKIAIVDSGAATTHPLLGQITRGVDIANPAAVDGWKQDTVAHGTHCAGVIAGSAAAHKGIRGFAPEAEVLVCKIFPGGRFSDLIDALDFCIAQQVDVVNLSLGSDQPSETVEQKLEQARSLGIACIVAAGNSAGPVQYPASSANVLAVSAIGKLNEFPDTSYHAQTIIGDPRLIGTGGFFAAKFSCFGPEVGVCGPGVAIVSSVPPGNYAAWDGTSMATPHVTGLAALILAHHPDFQGQFRTRNQQRVGRLFEVIRQSAQPVNVGDPNRTGAGLPDALRALPVAATGGATATAGDPMEQIKSLLQNLQGVTGGTTPGFQPVRAQMESLGILNAGRASTVTAGASSTSATAATRGGPPPSDLGAFSALSVDPPTSSGQQTSSGSEAPEPSEQQMSQLFAQLRKQMQDAQLLPAG